jgi:glycosyltransferase involved in cell wall biosynthesis
LTPVVTVVVPVYNRVTQLERALRSVQRQSYSDFECLVVDDSSTIPIEPIVGRMADPRFVYLRTETNGGPSAARFHGYRAMRGPYLAAIDSDDEARPHMLSSAVEYLSTWPSVGGVAGMTARADIGRPRVRVRGGRQVLTPDVYRVTAQLPDCVGVVRRRVVEDWLEGRHDYYAFEAQQWLTFHLRYSMLFVDDVWVDVHLEGDDRVTRGRDPRSLDDYVRFFEAQHDRLGTTPSIVLDRMVEDGWFQLTRAGRAAEAQWYATWMRERALSPRRVVRRRLAAKLSRSIRRRSDAIRWLG